MHIKISAFSFVFIVGIQWIAWQLTPLLASPEESSGEIGPVREEVESDGLPTWGDDDFREGFDVRLWPERTVLWLEQEHLRTLIADITTPESERLELRRLLAMQRTWKMHRRG